MNDNININKENEITILKDAFDVKAVGGAGFVIGAPLQVVRQLPGTRIVDHSRLILSDGV